MNNLLAFLVAGAAGAVTNVQVGANLQLFRGLTQPVLAAIVVLGAGLLVLLVALGAMAAFGGVAMPSARQLGEIPWWAWAGGALQAATLMAVFLVAGRSGSALFSALTITGGAICSILLDHYGLVGFQPHPANWSRAAGAALLVGGTVLMAR